MVKIRDIVAQTLATCYLGSAAENQMWQLLRSPYDTEDLKAFLTLQQSIMTHQVQQESREFRNRLFEPTKDISQIRRVQPTYHHSMTTTITAHRSNQG